MIRIASTGVWQYIPARQTFDWELAKNLVKFFQQEKISNVYDFGCGIDAFYVKYLNYNSIDAHGCEGNLEFLETVKRNFNRAVNLKKPERSKQINKNLGWHDAYIQENKSIFSKLSCLDLTKCIDLNCVYDWAISLEVAEHIPNKFESIYLDNIIRHFRNGLIISWAQIGQPGVGHVNCKNRDDVICQLKTVGLEYDDNSTRRLCENVVYKHFGNTMIFRK